MLTLMRDRYISVDVESSGPIPGEFSLLTIGACAVDDRTQRFQCSLKPLNKNADPKALHVTGLSLEVLEREGLAPADAMQRFRDWLAPLCEDGHCPIFVGLNAPFDWSFVNYYFYRFLGENPFGISALDIKALYMGATGCTWDKTTSSHMARRLKPHLKGTHDALEDALYQAELFSLIRQFQKL
jgi:ribonuclease T